MKLIKLKTSRYTQKYIHICVCRGCTRYCLKTLTDDGERPIQDYYIGSRFYVERTPCCFRELYYNDNDEIRKRESEYIFRFSCLIITFTFSI